MSRVVSEVYEFGPFRLDLQRRVFTREQQVVPLAPKTFDLLVLLVQSPRRAFSKQELMNALWPDTFVEEANLSFQISVLRKALGEDGARWIETVPKHGYRFGAEVRAPMPSADLAEPASSASNEPSSVILKRGTRKLWLASATVIAAVLVIVTFFMVVREPHTPEVRTAAAGDGRWIYFGSNRTGREEVWRMPAAGGAPIQITQQGGIAAIESRNGFLYYSKDASTPSSIWRVPINGGNEVRVVDGLSYSINFAVGKRGLYFVAAGDADDKPSVDFFDFATGKRSTLVHLDKPFWFGITLSPDERSLVFPLVDSAGSNLMLVDRFR